MLPPCLRADALEDAARALALPLDRGIMAGVLLQKQAEPAPALLPQWLSGYAFQFTMDTNLDRAREIRTALPADAATLAKPLRLQIDTPGDLAKLLGERVAVNARQASIHLQNVSGPAQRTATPMRLKPIKPPAGLHLFACRYFSFSPRAELRALADAQHEMESAEIAKDSADPKQLYARERRMLEYPRLLPLVAFPEYFGLGRNVRDWMTPRWGEWHLADVWLDAAQAAATSPLQALVPGAHP